MKPILKVFALSTIGLALAVPVLALPIVLTPSGPGLVASGSQTNQAEINAAIDLLFPGLSSKVMYKGEGAGEVGAMAPYYETTFYPVSPSGSRATISWVGPEVINANPVYAFIKNGNSSPNWYLFDISGWNGTDTIDFQGFFTREGKDSKAISNVALLGTHIPDGGSLAMLMGLGLLGLGALRRMVG